MMFSTPYWLRMLGGKGLTWEGPGNGKSLYLTFDDGPGPDTTPMILEMLNKHDTKATFFCVGANVEKYPGIYADILKAGHAVGNHSYNHLRGWETGTDAYVENVERCSQVVESRLFRPPYGKMTSRQRKVLKKSYNIIMWSVLSRDYDAGVSPERCLEQSWRHTRPGSIIVFHDHKKAIEKVKYVLPEYIGKAREENYAFEILSSGA